ncbi:MAG: FadR/GntR family transcriptional regulator [Gaiellaceae bacterium]
MTDSPTSEVVFHGIRSENLSERVYRQIIDAVRDKRLVAGQRLPSERELAEQFSVSRVIVREAFRLLAATGWIDVRPGRGAFVSASPSDAIAGRWQGWLLRHRGELLELLAIRQALEELSAREAGQRAKPNDIDRLEKNCAAFEAEALSPGPSSDRLTELDLEFHHAVAFAGHGRLLPKLVDELATVLLDSRRAMFVFPERPRWSAEDHRVIFDAIAAHDSEAAAAAMRAHMDKVISLVATISPDGLDGGPR